VSLGVNPLDEWAMTLDAPFRPFSMRFVSLLLSVSPSKHNGWCCAPATTHFPSLSIKKVGRHRVGTRFVNSGGLETSPESSSIRSCAIWHSSHVRMLDSSCFVVTDCWEGELPPDNAKRVVFGTNEGGGGVWGVGELSEWYLNHLPSAIRGVSDPSSSNFFETPRGCFPPSFSSLRPLFGVVMVTFGSAKVAVSCARRSFMEGEVGEAEMYGGDGSDPAVTHSASTRFAVGVTVAFGHLGMAEWRA